MTGSALSESVGICVNHRCAGFEYSVAAQPGDRCAKCEQLLTHWSGLTWEDAAAQREAARVADRAAGGRSCSVCGCTDNAGCDSGCAWASLDPPICTRCA